MVRLEMDTYEMIVLFPPHYWPSLCKQFLFNNNNKFWSFGQFELAEDMHFIDVRSFYQLSFQELISSLGKETFLGINFCEAKNSRNFRDKPFRMTGSDAFCKNFTFVNDYFNWQNLIIFRHIQANLFQSILWSSFRVG